jgi:hypothetical protein
MNKVKPAFLIIALIAVTCIKGWGFSFPNVFYFPFTPGFGFSLISDKGNSIKAVSAIEFSEDFQNTGVVFVNWKISVNKNNETNQYNVRLRVENSGEIYLSEIGDNLYARPIPNTPNVLPVNIPYKEKIQIGKNISLTFTGSRPSLAVNLDDGTRKVFQNVVSADLEIGDTTYTLYFARRQGVVGIRTADEIYRYAPPQQ